MNHHHHLSPRFAARRQQSDTNENNCSSNRISPIFPVLIVSSSLLPVSLPLVGCEKPSWAFCAPLVSSLLKKRQVTPPTPPPWLMRRSLHILSF